MKTVICERCGQGFDVPDASRARVCAVCHDEQHRSYMREYMHGRSASNMPATRLCHDCKKPTPDYRCPACREKWMRKHNVTPAVVDAGQYVESMSVEVARENDPV